VVVVQVVGVVGQVVHAPVEVFASGGGEFGVGGLVGDGGGDLGGVAVQDL
jgi:hypothetical protein